MNCKKCNKEMKLMAERPYGMESAIIGDPWWKCPEGHTEKFENKGNNKESGR